MEQSVSTYKKIRRLYRQSQKYAASRMEQPELTQSELQLLRHVGFHGEVSQRHLADEMGVDKAMISRILQKLEAKGFVKNEDATVTSLIGREQVQRAESSQLIERSFGGSLPAFLNAFLTGRRLTAEEARELHRLIEEAVPGDGASEEEHREEKGGSV